MKDVSNGHGSSPHVYAKIVCSIACMCYIWTACVKKRAQGISVPGVVSLEWAEQFGDPVGTKF